MLVLAHSDEEAAAVKVTVVRPSLIKTSRYDGKTDWEAFHAQFELLAQAGKWSVEVKAL